MQLSAETRRFERTKANAPGWLRRLAPYWQDYLFISPFFILFAVFFAYPLGWAFILSFQRWDGVTPETWVGLDNYRFVLRDPVTRTMFVNTLRYLVILVPLGLILPLFFGVLLNLAGLKLRGLFRTLIFLPAVTSIVGAGVVWRLLFGSANGWLNALLGKIGLGPYAWLRDANLAQIPIVTLTVWGSLGFATLIVLGGLQAIDQDMYDAAKLDGASANNIFWKITLPLMRPVLRFLLIATTIQAMTLFSQPYLITQGGPSNQTLTPLLEIYTIGVGGTGGARIGDASALSFLLSAAALLVIAAQFLATRRRERRSAR
jgi:ABC-type sugar transport system permease subunit